MAAIVLAAGLSERMGRFKSLLPLGKHKTIERVVKMFQNGGIDDIVVVTGHRAAERNTMIPTERFSSTPKNSGRFSPVHLIDKLFANEVYRIPVFKYNDKFKMKGQCHARPIYDHII